MNSSWHHYTETELELVQGKPGRTGRYYLGPLLWYSKAHLFSHALDACVFAIRCLEAMRQVRASDPAIEEAVRRLEAAAERIRSTRTDRDVRLVEDVLGAPNAAALQECGYAEDFIKSAYCERGWTGWRDERIDWLNMSVYREHRGERYEDLEAKFGENEAAIPLAPDISYSSIIPLEICSSPEDDMRRREQLERWPLSEVSIQIARTLNTEPSGSIVTMLRNALALGMTPLSLVEAMVPSLHRPVSGCVGYGGLLKDALGLHRAYRFLEGLPQGTAITRKCKVLVGKLETPSPRTWDTSIYGVLSGLFLDVTHLGTVDGPSLVEAVRNKNPHLICVVCWGQSPEVCEALGAIGRVRPRGSKVVVCSSTFGTETVAGVKVDAVAKDVAELVGVATEALGVERILGR